MTAIAAALGARGVKDKPHRNAVLSYIQGRPIESMKNLEWDEAGRVLDYLDALPVGAADTVEFVETFRPAVA